MAEKSKSFVCGLIEVVVPTGGSKRQRNEMSEVERTSKTIFKDKEGGCSTQLTKKHKAEEFVDKNTGRLGYKEEVKFKSTLKVDDKIQGCTNEFQTQVKFKKVTYPNKRNPKSSYKCVNYY